MYRKKSILGPCQLIQRLALQSRVFSNKNATKCDTITINNRQFEVDNWTTITPRIQSYMPRNIYIQKDHPLSIIRQEITSYFYKAFVNGRGNPLFSVFHDLNPVVTPQQNFDDLLIPADHVSRRKSDCYYLNKEYLLRAHTTAHQVDCLKSGLNNYLLVGEVYRRDEIDSTHFPVFHQLDGVRTIHRDKLFPDRYDLQIFESTYDPSDVSQFVDANVNSKCIDVNKQPCHTIEAVKLIEHELKTALLGLAQHLFGTKIEYRWVDAYFPFTHPSWELEIFHNGKWMEVLGSGIMRNEILARNGVQDTIGWAFGLGLERLAMVLFNIPDIRLFWSTDSGFLSQFSEETPLREMKYKAVSVYPQCAHDLSFWLPENAQHEDFAVNDFYDLVRNIAGDIVEQVRTTDKLIIFRTELTGPIFFQVHVVDKFMHPKTKKSSYTFRIIYRHMERTLTNSEVNVFHKQIEEAATREFNVKIR